MNKVKLIYLISSGLFLGLGICIYIIFRDIRQLLIIEKLNLTGNAFVELKPSFLGNVIKYNLPDMFWFVSGILFLRFIWFQKKEQNIYVLCFYLMGAVFELSQLLKSIPGIFDFLDLFFMGIGALVEGLLYKYYIIRSVKCKKQKKE